MTEPLLPPWEAADAMILTHPMTPLTQVVHLVGVVIHGVPEYAEYELGVGPPGGERVVARVQAARQDEVPVMAVNLYVPIELRAHDRIGIRQVWPLSRWARLLAAVRRWLART